MNNTFSVVLLAWVFVAGTAMTVYAQPLSYAEGGASVEDPGIDLTDVRYVDADGGDDDSDGTSPGSAWRSVGKVRSEIAGLPSGTHILFRRSRRWNSGSLKIRIGRVDGIVLGAYGPLGDDPPAVDYLLSFNGSANITVRDLEVRAIHFSAGSHHALVYNNIVHTMRQVPGRPNSVGINMIGGTHHMAVVDNLVYDIESNDGISIHDTNYGPVEERSSPINAFWIAGNIVIGNNDSDEYNMEELIDIATGQTQEGGHDLDGTVDIKLVDNRLRCYPVDGLSRFRGWGSLSAVIVAYEPRYLWIVANTISGLCPSRGIGLLSDEAAGIRDVQISGNVIQRTGGRGRSAIQTGDVTNVRVFHNTLLGEEGTNRSTFIFRGRAGLSGDYNLIASERAGLSLFAFTPDALTMFDHNWYSSFSRTEPTVGGRAFGVWQSESGFDANGDWGPVPGVTMPRDPEDPRLWDREYLRASFAPVADFEGCARTDTPGAFDCDGNRLGTELSPFEGLEENEGYGWEGPPLIRRRYPIPGLLVTCAEQAGVCCEGTTVCAGEPVTASDCETCCTSRCASSTPDAGVPDAASSDGGRGTRGDGGRTDVDGGAGVDGGDDDVDGGGSSGGCRVAAVRHGSPLASFLALMMMMVLLRRTKRARRQTPAEHRRKGAPCMSTGD